MPPTDVFHCTCFTSALTDHWAGMSSLPELLRTRVWEIVEEVQNQLTFPKDCYSTHWVSRLLRGMVFSRSSYSFRTGLVGRRDDTQLQSVESRAIRLIKNSWELLSL